MKATLKAQETARLRITPTQAIKSECRYCGQTKNFHGCASTVYKLNDMSLTPVKRIKAHCLTCVPEQSIFGVKRCDGRGGILKPRMCPLYPYRMGKNPNRKGRPGIAPLFVKKALINHLSENSKPLMESETTHSMS